MKVVEIHGNKEPFNQLKLAHAKESNFDEMLQFPESSVYSIYIYISLSLLLLNSLIGLASRMVENELGVINIFLH